MPEMMPFGKYEGKSVEQIAIADYKYFTWLVDECSIKKPSLKRRIEIVEYVLNNFIPVLPCGYRKCESGEPPQFISIYTSTYDGQRGSSDDFIYCSRRCFRRDPKVTGEVIKIQLLPLEFRTARSSTKFDTNHLVKLFIECMGMKEGRKTKEYLEKFIDKKECWEGDDPRSRDLGRFLYSRFL